MRVVWSDETKINRFGTDGTKWSWKSKNEMLKSHNVNGTLKFGRGSVMIWECMTQFGPGLITRIDGALDGELYCEILKDELVNSLKYYGINLNHVIFQHDNDPKHKSKIATECLERLKINVIDWPTQSPDLNPIEYLCKQLKYKLCKYDNSPSEMLELWDRVQEKWNSFDKQTCLKLIKSMPNRIEQVYKAKGGYTKYKIMTRKPFE